jgi:hypothetical protein
MWTRTARWTAILGLLPLLCASMPQPSDWVPARWPWPEAKSLELLADSSVNCLLLKTYSAGFVAAAAKRGLVTLAVVSLSEDAVAAARNALSAGVNGIVMEGDFPDGESAAVRQAAGDAPVIELRARNRLQLGSKAPIIGTYQGVWPGVVALESNAGPTGSTWIQTNTGFIRAVRAWGDAMLWIANEPPPKTVVTSRRYQQAIADAAVSGARWVIAFDSDFAARLHGREEQAMRDWRAINEVLRYFQQHPEWRVMREYGKMVLVQDPARGGLVSGGILDMIAVKRLPLRVVPRQLLTAEALRGVTVVVNVDSGALTAGQEKVLHEFTRSGGMVLTRPPAWGDSGSEGNSFTLDKPNLDRLNDLGDEVNSLISPGSFGVRLFNASSMLSYALVSNDGQTIVVHLVNYSDYPVENVTLMFPSDHKKVTFIAPEGSGRIQDMFQTPNGSGVGVEKVSVCAVIKLEQ